MEQEIKNRFKKVEKVIDKHEGEISNSLENTYQELKEYLEKRKNDEMEQKTKEQELKRKIRKAFKKGKVFNPCCFCCKGIKFGKALMMQVGKGQIFWYHKSCLKKALHPKIKEYLQ